MSKRSDIDDLASSNIIKNPNLATSLQKDAKDLEHQLKTDLVSTKLKGQKPASELEKSGILKSGMAPSLQGAAGALEHQLKTDTVKQQLAVRGDEESLQKRNIVSPRGTAKVPAQYAMQAFELDKSMKKDAVSKVMQNRRTAEELEQSGIMYSSTQVRSDTIYVFIFSFYFFFCWLVF